MTLLASSLGACAAFDESTEFPDPNLVFGFLIPFQRSVRNMAQPLPDFFRHTRRPEWGLAVLAWERDGKRAYLFEGGMLKVLAEPFFGLMQPMTEPPEDGASIVQRLAKHLEANESIRTSTRASLPPNVSLEDQVGLLKGEFPGGFAGTEWQDKVRGLGQQRRLKRHRNAAIEHARAELSQAKLDEYLQSKRYSEAWAALAEVLSASDLAPPKQVETLKGRSDKATAQSVEVLIALLYGEGDFAECFDAFVKELRRMLGSSPSWELATATSALVHPEVHVCVRKTSFQRQAEMRMASVGNSQRPNSAGYVGFLDLAKNTMQALTDLDVKPEDFLDVHDFLKLATTPSAIRRIEAVRRAVNRAAASEESVADA
jgi:hypothetical protein